MTHNDWNETAKVVARYMGQFRPLVERGAVPLQFQEPAVADERGPLVVGVFGNDQALGGAADREVAMVRTRLHDAALQEVGFGLSEDGSSWALLIAADGHRFQTNAGRAFQKELLTIFLDDLVWRAWRNTNAVSSPR